MRQILQCVLFISTLQEKLNDYEIVLQMMTSFFKNYLELDKLMTGLEKQYKHIRIPKDMVRKCIYII